MKKVIIREICLITLILYSTGCFIGRNINNISNTIEISLDNCKIESEKDTHGGFLGDGDYFAKIICNKINYDKLSSNWKKLPITKSIKQVMDMKQCMNDGCKTVYEKYSIPDINNGYYYFYDRHSESNNKYDDKELNNRSSYNFTIALLDIDNNTIYYYEIDT